MNAVPVLAAALLAAIATGVVLDPRRVPRPHADARPTTTGRVRSRRAGIRWRGRRGDVVGPDGLGRWADDIARALRHGSTLRAALVSVVPEDALRKPAAALRLRIERGATVSEAVDAWGDDIAAARPGGGELLIALATVIGAAAELGGSVSTPLERFAMSMRRRVSDELERGAQSAQARLSARVLTMVPVAMLALLLATDADVRAVLGEATGATAVGVGMTLNVTGGWWMRRIVSGVERRGH